MPVTPTYPGVYIQEVPSGVRTITGVATSIAMFVGRTERGILNKPALLFSFSDYERKFGSGTKQSEMAHQLRQFFLNGGRQAYVMRVAAGAKEASVDLHSEAGTKVLEVTAKEAGKEGDRLRIEVDYDTPAPDKTFNLRVFRFVETGTGGFSEEDQEFFSNLTMDSTQARYAPDVVTQGSSLIALAEPDPVVVIPSPGISVAGQVLPSPDTAADSELATIIGGGKNKLRISVDGTSFEEVDLTSDTGVSDIGISINDHFGSAVVAVDLVPIGSAPNERRLLRITNASSQDVIIEPASNAATDFGTALQLGVGQGGVEIGAHALRRPAPSGLFFEYGVVFANLGAFGTSQQDSLTSVTVAGTTISGLDLETTAPGDLMVQGQAAPGFDSLANVREKLQRLLQQFNNKALSTPDFNWSMELQGNRIVLKPTAGDANTGVGTAVATALSTSLSDGIESNNSRYYSLGPIGGGGFQVNGSGGLDGNKPTLATYQNAFPIIDREVDIFNLLLLPRDADDNEDRTTVWGPASVFVQKRRAFLLIDPPKAWKEVSDVTTGTPVNIGSLRQGLMKDHAAIYWPRVRVVDPATGLNVTIDPSGSVAGVAARIDGNRGVWKAPAGIEADIRGIRGVDQAMSDPENGVINPQAVNAIRVFPNGIVSWGARTMDGFDNSGNLDYKYVPVRRFALFIEESLYRGLKFAVFEPNDEPLWAQIRLAAGAFMNNLFRQGAFQGQKASDAYFVKCDSETTTQNDINLGIVNVVVGFAPLKPAEFVIITIQQMAGQVQT